MRELGNNNQVRVVNNMKDKSQDSKKLAIFYQRGS